MKKLILTSVLLCGLLSTAVFAADTNTVSGGLFNAKEFSLSLGSGYALDRSAAFQQPYTLNANVGSQFFLTRSFGIEADVPFYQTKGVSVSEVQAGLVLRLPLARENVRGQGLCGVECECGPHVHHVLAFGVLDCPAFEEAVLAASHTVVVVGQVGVAKLTRFH